MMRQQRTDLAAEARQIWQGGAGEAAALPGVSARDYRRRGFSVTRVEILDGAGAEALGKPAGTYITVDLGPYFENRGERFAPAITGAGFSEEAGCDGLPWTVYHTGWGGGSSSAVCVAAELNAAGGGLGHNWNDGAEGGKQR